jgi:hypothetical protein
MQNPAIHICLRQFDYDKYSKLTSSLRMSLTAGDKGELQFAGGIWKYKLISKRIDGYENGQTLELQIELKKGNPKECNVSLELDFPDWFKDNYVLMPGAAYNGNRFESRRIAYSPKLLDPRDIGPDKPPIISDVPRLNINDGPSEIHDRSGAMSIPSVGFYSPENQYGMWLLSKQASRFGDFGYSIIETRSRKQATFSISAPVVRQLYKYHITDNQYPSDDRAPDWKTGDKITIPIQLYLFDCHGIQQLFDYWNKIKNNLIPHPEPLITTPFSSTFPLQEEKFNSQNWVEDHGYYSVGMREMFLQDWQLGWTGGMITTYPLLFNGNEQSVQRVMRNFDFLFPNGISPSGFFWDCGESKDDGFHWYGGDIRKPHTANWHLVRKSADGLYFISKQLMLMEKRGITIKPEWRKGLESVGMAFIKLWKDYKQTGQFVDSLTGEIRVGGSTSAALAPAGLQLTAQITGNYDFTLLAVEMADCFYENYLSRGITTGGVGDALQNPDSESSYALMESFTIMAESSSQLRWLEYAKEMASQFATWVMSYNYEFPPESTLGKLTIKTLGAVFANTQNKHAAPGICTHSGVALLRLYRMTRNISYLEMLRDIARFIPQILSTPEKPVPGMQPGWMTERVSTTDWFEGIGELMTGSTWAETALMLTYTEIPAIYVIPDEHFVFCIDSLLAELFEIQDDKYVLSVKNPSDMKVKARIMIENSKTLIKPLEENHLLKALEVDLVPGEEKRVEIDI